MKKQPIPIYQFYSELEGYKPKIWRRFQTAGNITVARFGYIVMTMYRMEAEHLLSIEHERPLLTPSGKLSRNIEFLGRYSIPDEEDCSDFDFEDATKTKLSQINLEAPSRLAVWYDFGDDWRVLASLETAEINYSDLPAKELPRVIEGDGFGIIEDCGGIFGLMDITRAFKDKKGEKYKQYREWLGVDDLDMAAFDLDDMNLRLKKLPAKFAKIYERKK